MKLLKEIEFEKAEYSVFDFETTGTSARFDKVIEIGIAKISKGKIIDTFQSFINPGRPIPFFITQYTGITNSDVQDAPYFEELFYRIKDFIGYSVLAAHNLNFDYSFLKHECSTAGLEIFTNPSICTLKIARKLYPDAPSKSLGRITKYLKIQHKNVHRGLGDATATAKLLMKMFKPLRDNYEIDTVTDLVHFQNSPTGKQFSIIKKKLIKDFAEIPDMPGVYFFKNIKGDIIYIGKAKSLKNRVANYFSNNAPRKSKEIVKKANGLNFQPTNTELTALLTEAELIKEENPKYNKLLKKYSKNYFICLDRNETFSPVNVVSNFDFDGNDYFGPYPNRDTVNAIKEIIDKTFQLRECNKKEFVKKRKCYLSDIERCLEPCTNSVSLENYNVELDKVYDFLGGHNQSSVDRLLNKMKMLSEKKKYEEAAEVRDIVNSILKQLSKSSILSEPINKANVLIEVNENSKKDYILLIEGKITIHYKTSEIKFLEALQDYFQGTIHLYEELTDKDLERLKITLNWMIRNKEKIKVHYLKNYNSVEETATHFIF